MLLLTLVIWISFNYISLFIEEATLILRIKRQILHNVLTFVMAIFFTIYILT